MKMYNKSMGLLCLVMLRLKIGWFMQDMMNVTPMTLQNSNDNDSDITFSTADW